MEVTAVMVKELRARTGAGVLDCRTALVENNGDVGKSVEYLQKKSLASAAKKATRIAAEGAVGSYIHMGGKIGVLCEINCETDFVAKTEQFQDLMRNICLQVAAFNATCLTPDDLSSEETESQKAIYIAQARESGKPEAIIPKIIEGKMKKWYTEVCLLNQSYVKDTDKTIQDLVTETVAQLGENIKIRRFARFELGEGLEKRSDDFASEVASAAGTS